MVGIQAGRELDAPRFKPPLYMLKDAEMQRYNSIDIRIKASQ